MNNPIRRVTQIQTGTADLHAEHVEGTTRPALFWIFFGRDFVERVPVSVFVIEHHDGLLLVDAGMSPRVTSDPSYWPDAITAAFMKRIFRFAIAPEDALATQLERAGYSASAVDKAVITHLHFDHVGGIGDIPGAELICSQQAWAHMQEPRVGRHGVLRSDIELPEAHWCPVGFAPLEDESLRPFTEGHDLMGDGSIVLLPTPGHLPGSLSVFLRAEQPILLVGDLCYRTELLMKGQLPGTGDHGQLAESWAKVRALAERHPDLLIVPSHDPAAVQALREHPLATAPATAAA